MSDLAKKRCGACNKDTPRLSDAQITDLGRQTPDWNVRDHKLERTFTFPAFMTSIAFVDRMAEISESEGHHPVFTVDYDKVRVQLWTHAIGALSENDFILASKLDEAAAQETFGRGFG